MDLIMRSLELPLLTDSAKVPIKGLEKNIRVYFYFDETCKTLESLMGRLCLY